MGRFVERIQALALAIGAPGLFIVAFLDSSVLPLPEMNDLLLVWMATQHKQRMVLYAACAVLGSVAGSLVPYGIGRKGGEAFIRKRFSAGRVDRVTAALKRHGVLAVLVACLLPPPAPFKLFMMLSGAAGISVVPFSTAIAIGRSIRFFGLGFLAVRYGDRALALIRAHGATVSLTLVGLLLSGLAGYALWRRVRRGRAPARADGPIGR
jgi:membrane protein YqaA with SNARE-associated domain